MLKSLENTCFQGFLTVILRGPFFQKKKFAVHTTKKELSPTLVLELVVISPNHL